MPKFIKASEVKKYSKIFNFITSNLRPKSGYFRIRFLNLVHCARMANPRFTTSTNDYNKETKEKFKNEFSNWQSKKPRNIDTNWFTTAKGNMGCHVSKKSQ